MGLMTKERIMEFHEAEGQELDAAPLVETANLAHDVHDALESSYRSFHRSGVDWPEWVGPGPECTLHDKVRQESCAVTRSGGDRDWFLASSRHSVSKKIRSCDN